MDTHRLSFSCMISLGLLILTAGAFAQDTIRWQEGKAVCESTYEWDAASGGLLKVEANAMDVTMMGGAGDKIRLTEEIVLNVDDEKEVKKYFEMYRVQLEKSGDEFQFESPETHRPFKGGSLTFYIPDSFNVQVNTSGGDLEASNIIGNMDLAISGGDIEMRDITGDVNISTSGGDISVNRVEGKLKIATSGGDINATRCSAEIAASTSGGDIGITHMSGLVNASTYAGDILLSDLDGSANLSTSGGDIEISEVKGNKTVNAATYGGDVTAENIVANISLSTTSGDIELTAIKGSVNAATSNGDISGSNIEGSMIKAATSRGDVDLKFVLGNLKIAASNGDLFIKVKKSNNSFETELSSSDGDVECVLPDDYKASVNARIRNWNKQSDNDISSDFNLRIRTENSHNRVATGEINGGGPPLRIETSRGGVRIEKY
jgi:DUF4097 and DUF4098 domain-containing protein YvlB